jgi:tetratricopeptide (TPR) repeat protein
MSLLLDALKRAEEAKRAKRPVETVAVTDNEIPSSGPAPAVEKAAPSLELRLDDYKEVIAPRVTPRNLPGITVPPPAERKTAESDLGGLALEATQVASVLRNESAVRPEPAPVSPPVAPLAGGKADFTQQRDAARNIFSAKQPLSDSASPNRRKWILPAVAFAVVLVGGGAWYVWNEINRISRPAIPMAARPATPSAPVASAEAPAVATAAVPAPVPAATVLPPAATTTGQLLVQAGKSEPAKTAELTLPPLLPPEQAAPLSKPPRSSAKTPLSSHQAMATALRDAPGGRDAPLALRRALAVEPPSVSPALMLAYTALKAGEFRDAKEQYAKVIAATPLSIDGQLGLATAAARLGETALANRHYRETLNIDPRNSTAIAGLLALTSDGGGAAEVELKTLIAKNPGAASLQFALGNQYSSSKRWTEAQQAYFEAFRLDSESPDYAYNLAVSLDQLRQSRLAREYYQKAVALLSTSGGQFDRNAAIRRIQELSRDSAN